MTDIPAGWYPNPDNGAQERYWDGTNWTEQFRPSPQAVVPPPPPMVGAPPQTIVVQQPKSNRGCLYAVVAFVALALVGCIGAIALVSRAAEEVADNFEEFAETLSENERLVAENARILRCEKSQIGNVGEVTVEFVSPFDEEKGFISVEISFIDPADVVLGSTRIVFEDLEPGRTAREDGRAFDLPEGAKVERCELSDTSVL